MEAYNQTLPLSQLGDDKTVATMATASEQQQQMAAYIELLNKSGGSGEALSGELINYNHPQGCIIL